MKARREAGTVEDSEKSKQTDRQTDRQTDTFKMFEEFSNAEKGFYS